MQKGGFMMEMKKFKRILSFLLCCMFFTGMVLQPSLAKASEDDIMPVSDYAELSEVYLQNGQSYMWTGSEGKGFYLNKGDKIYLSLSQYEYQGGNGIPVYGHVEFYIYQYNENTGRFTLSQQIIPSYDDYGICQEIYYGSVPSSGYYAFGTRNFNLSPLYFSGSIFK